LGDELYTWQHDNTPHHTLSDENTLTCQDKNTNHKTHPTAYLTQGTYHHLTQHTIDHNANTLI